MDRLVPHAALRADESLVSSNGLYRLIYQRDGNLVLYEQDQHRALWATDTAGSQPGQVVMQGDGNLVMYAANGEPIWSSGTVGLRQACLILLGDGNLVVNADGAPAWTSSTAQNPEELDVPPDPLRPIDVDPVPSGSTGLVVHADDVTVRPRLSIALPHRGPFLFPAPYGTQGIRLTNEDDGEIEPVGYSYWSNLNMHAGRSEMLAFVGRAQQPPLLLRVTKATLAVDAVGALPRVDTGEGLYWSSTDPDTLYVPNGARLERYNVQSRTTSVVFDAAERFGNGKYIWQCHTSYAHHDGAAVHSMTLRQQGTWQKLGSAVYAEASRQWSFFPAQGELDECQIDKSGRWLLIKEGDDNRIVDLATGSWSVMTNAAGAVGHSDCGFGYVVGEDDQYPKPGAIRLYRFGDGGACQDGTVVYFMPDPGWHSMARHVAHGNARPGAPEGQRVVISSAHRDHESLPRANEIVVVPLDGSLTCTVVCPTLVELDAPGGGDDYRKLPKANVDFSGQWCVWTSNHGTARLDAFIVRLP